VRGGLALVNILPTLQHIGVRVPDLAELFDHIEDVLLWIKDAKGRYQWVNTAFVLNFGVKERAGVVAHTDFDLCSLPLANQYRLDDERVLRGERIIARVELVGRFDHTVRWCETTKIPVFGRSGRIVGTAGVTRPLNSGPPHRPAESTLSGAIRYASEHYAESITNEELARACGLSLRAFERRFRASYGASPHDYLRELRIRISCNPLVFSRKSIIEIASDSGFADQSHFAREFRRVMGETPTAYRLRHTLYPASNLINRKQYSSTSPPAVSKLNAPPIRRHKTEGAGRE
jgi:AraC-like DNA-binding protein